MHPLLFRLGPWEVRGYGLMLATSFLLGTALIVWRARRAGLDPLCAFHFSLYGMIAAIVGSRLLYVALNWRDFRDDLLAIALPVQDGTLRMTGLVMNGGVVPAALFLWWYARRHRMPILKTLDIAAPSLALGIFFTRIGCFLNGCCYGLPTDLPWGTVFSATSPAGNYQRHGLVDFSPLHPTQLYSSAYGLTIFVTLLLLERRCKRFDGFTTALLLVLYPASRFVVEFFRVFYDDTGQWFGLTHNQYLSLGVMAGSATGLFVLYRRHCSLPEDEESTRTPERDVKRAA